MPCHSQYRPCHSVTQKIRSDLRACCVTILFRPVRPKIESRYRLFRSLTFHHRLSETGHSTPPGLAKITPYVSVTGACIKGIFPPPHQKISLNFPIAAQFGLRFERAYIKTLCFNVQSSYSHYKRSFWGG